MTERRPQLSGTDGLFQPVRQQRMSDRIADQMRTAIRNGEMRPGDRLPSERELAERFQVSRVTVRDALRILEVLGLVAVRVGAAGGNFVSSPTTEVVGEGFANLLLMSELEPQHVTEARILIELGTVSMACVRATDDDVGRLRLLVEEGRDRVARDEYETSLSREFHRELARATHNPAIALLTDSFLGPLSMATARQREPQATVQDRTVRDHARITEAIATGDARAAQEAMVRHLSRGVELREQLRNLIADLFGLPA